MRNEPQRTRRSTAVATVVSAVLVSTLLFISPRPVQAANGIVNSYQVATVVGTTPDSSGLNSSDCALVIQMTGTIANGLGTYEILDPATTTPVRSYAAAEAVQFVILPGGCSSAQTVDAAGVQAQAWNGSTGGVIFLGGSSLTMNGDIDASGTGFTQTAPPTTTVSDGGDGILTMDPTRSFPDTVFTGAGGGGGILGGGGGGGSSNYTTFNSNNAAPGEGGSLVAGGAGGVTSGVWAAGDGGDPAVPGNGGSGAVLVTGSDVNRVGAGGAGGGSYGGGGGSCGTHFSTAYSAGGGGGASWTGGGTGGLGGTSTGPPADLADGGPGANNFGAAIPLEGAVANEHYLHDDDPRLMMGGAGGNHRNNAGGGAGGGIVVLDFDNISGNGNDIVSNGGAGAPLLSAPASGAGGGGGGQVYVRAYEVNSVDTAANGGVGGNNTVGPTHSAVAGSGGGAGAIWFDGAGSDGTNTGANDGATSDASALAPSGFSSVSWQVTGGGPGTTSSGVTIGGFTYTALAWNTLYNTAGNNSILNGTTHLSEAALLAGVSEAAIIEAFPAFTQVDNPKNAGASCMAAAGGNGLVRVSPPPPASLELEKATNGLDSDVAPGQTLTVGESVTWTYDVTVGGWGAVDNVTVTDSLVPAGDIECDVDSDGTYESGNNVGSIDAPASFSCRASSTAVAGQYMNTGTVTGSEGGNPLDDTDPSHYVGETPAITVEKQTNAAEADSDTLNDGSESPASTSNGASNPAPIASAVSWTFQIRNNGAVPLTNVAISDVTTTANDQNHVITIACDWASSSDATTAALNLSVGETVNCTASGTAGTGLHENTATATGDAAGPQSLDVNGDPVYDLAGDPVFAPNPGGTFTATVDSLGAAIEVVDADASGYVGLPPAISIVKTVVGTADGDVASVVEGQAVAWEFLVTNTGAGALDNVSISDPILTGLGVSISCPVTSLAQGAAMTCTAASPAGAGDLVNAATVTGDPAGGGSSVTDNDDAEYTVGVPAIQVVKTTCTDPLAIPASCSDGPLIPVGDALAWNYVITNTGEVTLVNVSLDDDIEASVDATNCDWASSSDAATAANVLSVGETVSCTQTGTAAVSGYDNVGSVTGVPGIDDGTPSEDPSGDPLTPVVDDDPSDYFGVAVPSVDIEKTTNGVQADTGTGPLVLEGDPVDWVFVVTNNGNVDLSDVVVTDVVTTDNGTADDPDGVVCDWANSSDAATPARNLSVNETVTCTASSTAEFGQYTNDSSVTGTPVADAETADPDSPVRLTDVDGNPVGDVNDDDPSAYFGPNASIDIEKDTNGNQADVLADQDTYSIGDAIDWTFVVRNDGNVDLADVTVSDTVTIDNGTAADPDGVVCDWANSSDGATPARNLSVGETVTCTASSSAEAGQYRNVGDVVGTPVDDAVTADPDAPTPLQDESGTNLANVVDDDPSHYYGEPAPSIDIEKDTNGTQADLVSDQDYIAIDDPVTWTFAVRNDGNVDLADVVVTDSVTIDNGTAADPDGVVCDWANSSDSATPARNLSVNETVTCTSSSIAEPGQYGNLSNVSGTPVADATTADPDAPVALQGINGVDLVDVTDADPSHYFGLVLPAVDIEKDTNGFQADTGTGPLVFENDPVLWTFEVENTGNVALGNVTVTDVVTTDNGTADDPDGVVCDWANSSDATTPARVLSVDETVTCTSSSTAELGQYRNNSNVVGAPLANDGSALLGDDGNPMPNVTDQDPSGYFGPNASIDIEKDTNGTQADVIGDQDTLAVGDAITWNFVVTNDGNVDLADVTVNDTVTIDNGTGADPFGVQCDWADSSDPATPARNLSVGESVECFSTSVAAPGQYRNVGDVVGTPVADAVTADPNSPTPLQDENGTDLADVVDDDPSHYYAAPQPAIDIEKDTNGNQADVLGDQDYLAIGAAVTWTFEVENTGDVDLADVVVTDSVTIDNGTAADPDGVVCDWANSSDSATPARNLSVNETVTCTSSSIAVAGQYRNNSTVVGTPVADAETADPDAPVALQDIDGVDLVDVTDADPSHYYGLAIPAIDIEKDTNGFQADTGTGPVVFEGDAVVWTFEVQNTGNVALGNVTVTDAVTTDNGTAADPAGVVCDWANSSDAATPAQVLSVNETVTCTAASTAELGQYNNNSNVVGTPLAVDGSPLLDDAGMPVPNVVDQDPSGYFGPDASIDIEKDTNGNQADLLADQDSYSIGDAIDWTFVVRNDGNVDLADVTVADTVTIDNGTAADPAGVVCDWPNSSDAATSARNLSVGETVTCTSSSAAEAGQYRNVGDVVGTPVADAVTADPNSPTPLQDENGTDLADVVDDDPSHYYAAPQPAIDIEKDTNGNQADTLATQDILAIGDAVVWTFVVENTGDVDLADVVVTDSVTIDNGTAADPAGVVCDWANSSDAATPARNLSVGETVECTSGSVAEAGQYANLADVVGTPVADAVTADPDAPVALQDINGVDLADVVDDDPSHYYAQAVPAIDIEKDTNGFQADTGTGPVVFEGDAVVWTFEVQNTGNVALGSVTVTDAVTTDNGTAADPDGVVCDWANSSDAATPDQVLSVNETVTCTAASTAELGQYNNNSNVVGAPLADDGSALLGDDGVPLPNVTDQDPSGYFGPTASIDIEKDTNGNQADVLADQDVIAIGDAVVWTFEVENTGNVDLAAVTVSDTVTTDNGTAADPNGVVCDWANSSDPATPAGNLSVDETVTCVSMSTAAAGQYRNDVDVVGTPVADAVGADPLAPSPLTDFNGTPMSNVTDADPSHYYGDPQPSIDIEKDTNGNQADVLADQDIIPIGAPVTWTFVVVNDGNVDLSDVTVVDSVTVDNGTVADPDGVVCDWANSSDAATPARNLAVNETVTCTSTSTAEAGQYRNDSDVVGTPVADATTADPDAPVALQDIDGNDLADVIDADPSHYYGDAIPGIDIEKDTNGFQADTGTGPLVLEGDAVTWTYVVTNIGTSALADVVVTDTVTLDNGTAADPDGVVCDWANSTDAATPAGTLARGEQVTCTASSVAELGQYRNDADVVAMPIAANGSRLLDEDGAPFADVTDEDPSAYFGPSASIDIEKDTNGTQADVLVDQDTLSIGAPVTWTFVVTNDGNVDLADVTVSDTVTIDNGTAADLNGVVCDWASSSDAATPARNLSVGETVSCTSNSVAVAGQYRNDSDVVGTPVADATTADPNAPTPLQDENGNTLTDVTDADPSHYYAQPQPSIDIEKDTNGNQADVLADQDTLAIGSPVTWTFDVVNDGNVDLADVLVTDTVTVDNGTIADPDGVVCDWANSSDATTPARNLSVGETVTCTSSSIAEAGQYRNDSNVTGTPVADATTADPDAPVALQDIDGNDLADVTDDDPSHYYGDAIPQIDIEKDTNGFQADTGTGPLVFLGDTVTWTFVVTNTGTATLSDVTVTDTVTTDNGTAVDPDGVVCDWANSSDVDTPADTLAPLETVTCTASSSAELGQYNNVADVVGTPVGSDGSPLLDPDGNALPNVTDDDPSAYFGPDASIDIEKDTNGNQADVIADQDIVPVGSAVVWTFVVENTGNVDLANVDVTDVATIDNGTAADPAGVVCDWANSSDADTPARNLSIGETVTCTSASQAEAGQYGNLSAVVGTPVADAITADPFAPTPLVDETGTELPAVSDSDPSHYFGEATPAIDIEKDTNGNQADVLEDQSNLALGDDVVWTFVVTNTGDTDLSDVTVVDTVTIDNGTAPDPDGVVCDWANSSDAATPARNLSVGETVTCTSSSTVENGQYRNDSDVTGTPVADAITADPDAPVALQDIDGADLADVTDEDPSHYFGAQSAIVIEKDTNGNQADVLGGQDNIEAGAPVVWTFVVTNTGNVDLADVIVTDTVTIDNGTAADPAGVVCDWANSSDAATPARNLSIDETVTCTASSTAVAGQYRNDADVIGTPVADATTADPDNPTPIDGPDGQPIPKPTDADPSHYFGVDASIDIEKDTNGNQADVAADQDVLAIATPITWTFDVLNDGNVDLADVVVTDTVTIDNGTAVDPAGVVCDWANSSDAFTPAGNLSVGETVRCTSTSMAAAGQYANLGDVVGTPVDDATDPAPTPLVDGDDQPLPAVTDDDPSHYFGGAQAAIDIEKDTNGNQADTISAQDSIPVGAPITWTYVVTNIGDVDLINVVVTDTVAIDNGTVAPDTVVCDWENSSDAATPIEALSVGETVTCLASSTAAPGQYRNDGDVVGTPVLDATVANPEPVLDGAGDPLADVTDTDPSHYMGAAPSIDVEKDTNGNQADLIGEQQQLAIGEAVTWTYVLTNDGNTDLADVSLVDDVVIDNGTASSAITCDWDASTNEATPDGALAMGESVICTATGTAVVGQYGNLAEVVGTPVDDATLDTPEPVIVDGEPLPPVDDADPSHYFGRANPSIGIEKDTNGVQADTIADQGGVDTGAGLLWTFVVTNDGDVDLAEVALGDTVTIDNGTTHDSEGIVCDWANSSDAATPADRLSVGETVTCTLQGVAGAGQYGNLADVVATPVTTAVGVPELLLDPSGTPLADVVDEDPSHVFAGFFPAIDIEKATNGIDADTTEDQPFIDPSGAVLWTFEVRNTGNVDLAGVEVEDAMTIDNGTVTPAVVCDWDTSSDPATPARNLSVGETVSCTSSATAESGQYANVSSVTATPVLDATTADPDAPTPLRDIDDQPVADVSDDDPSHYFGPVFDLALRKQLSDGTNLGKTKIGETVTFTITLFNQGNVPASNIEVVDYLPSNLELADPAWVAVQGGALIALDGTILQPGDTTTVDITVKVIAGGERLDTEIDVEAEISKADGVDDDGEPIMLQGVNGVPLALLDVDSVPDANNDEAPVEDEIDNADGDEDDHDRVGLIIEADPVDVVDPPEPTPTTPSTPNTPAPELPTITNPPAGPAPTPQTPEPSGPLAFTGADSAHLAAIAAMLITAGGALMILGRRHDEDDQAAGEFG